MQKSECFPKIVCALENSEPTRKGCLKVQSHYIREILTKKGLLSIGLLVMCKVTQKSPLNKAFCWSIQVSILNPLQNFRLQVEITIVWIPIQTNEFRQDKFCKKW